MHLLDTDTLTHLYAGHSSVMTHLEQIDDLDVGITVITKIELLRGRFEFLLKAATGSDLLKAQYWLHRTEELLAQILVFPLNEDAAAHFDRLRIMKGMRKIGRADLLIASIALSHRATLVTRNVRHFQHVPGLTVTNWVE